MRDNGHLMNIYDNAHCWVCHIAHKDAYVSDFIICLKLLNTLESFKDWSYPQEFHVSTLGALKK